MSPKTAIAKPRELAQAVRRWIEGYYAAPSPDLAPVPIRNSDFSQLAAKEKGEWYLHTVLGR